MTTTEYQIQTSRRTSPRPAFRLSTPSGTTPWDPLKMKKRTQFCPPPTALSDCVAYEWRPPNHFGLQPKIGLVLGLFWDYFMNGINFCRTSCETASNGLPANHRQDATLYRKQPITLWNCLAYCATVAQRRPPVKLLRRILFEVGPSKSDHRRFGAYQLHRQTPDRRCPSARPGRTAVSVRGVAKKAGVHGPQAERAVQKAEKDLLAPVQPADVEPGEVHPRDQQDLATRLYGYQVARRRPPKSPRTGSFARFFNIVLT